MSGTCSTYGREERCIECWCGNLRGKNPLGRTRRRWENNIKTDLQKVGCGGMDWIYLAQDRDSLPLLSVLFKVTVTG